MTVQGAIASAEKILPGNTAPEGEQDARWQALIAIGEYAQSDPAAIWPFALKWGSHEDEDLRAAVATVLLEHFLEYHFDLIFPKVEAAVRSNPSFAKTFKLCGQFGQAEEQSRAKRMARLKASL